MAQNKMHISGPGSQRAGQWVKCTANTCRLGGIHTDTKTLTLVHSWKKDQTQHKVNKSDLTLEDLKNYKRLPQETRDAYKEAYETKIEKKKKLAPQARIPFEPPTRVRQLEARKPLLDVEAEVTATTVTFENGLVRNRRLYSLEQEKSAKIVQEAAEKVIADSQNRALTPDEVKSYVDLAVRHRFLPNKAWNAYREFLLNEPEKRSSFEKTYYEVISNNVMYGATDVRYGYEFGSFRQYMKAKRQQQEQKEESLNEKIAQEKELSKKTLRGRIKNLFSL